MKLIQKKNKKLSIKLKVVITLSVIIFIIAFMVSLQFSGNSKKDFPDLHFSEKIKSPKCSYSGGFHKEAFALSLASDNVNAKIYYTTDGSEPSLASSLYTHPFIIEDKTNLRNHLSSIPTSPRWKPPVDNVFKGTVVRVIAVDDNNNKSRELVRTFFVDAKGSDRYSLPVISLTINEKDFFGYKNGIYVLGKSYTDKDNYIRKKTPLDLPWWEYPSNYLMRGDDAERPAHIEFYEPNGNLGFESNVGVRINGNATRGFAQKSLRISFREKYGQSVLNYSLFPSNSVKRYNSFILRNSGNDWDKTMFRDAFMQSLMQNTHVETQDYRPSIVFINGEYWGIHNTRERFDENYIVNKYHLSADSITILELSGKLIHGKKGEENLFTQLLDFVKNNDLSKEENYLYVKSKIDIESFIDFVIANVYFCNSDWPDNNVRFWRYAANPNANSNSSVKDGRWRWMLYDTDWGFGYNSASTPQSDLLQKATKVGSVGILFRSLLKNKDFTKEFLSRFQYLLNTTFYSSSVIKKINDFEKVLSPEMQEHINRWRAINDYGSWLSNVDVMKDFAKKRPDFQAKQLNTFFNLSSSEQIYIPK